MAESMNVFMNEPLNGCRPRTRCEDVVFYI